MGKSNKLSIRLHEAVARSSEILSMLRMKGYTQAEEDAWIDNDELVCYKEFPTGVEVPSVATLLVHYFGKAGELAVEVVASSYEKGTTNGVCKDMFCTFLEKEYEKVSRLSAEGCIDRAERAMKMYISALNEF